MSPLTLMPHQRTGGAFLAPRPFALLLDDMGLGKTVTAVHGADLAGCQKILILCPAAVRPHWARSVAAWQQIDRPITVLTELPKTPPGDGVTIASHDALARAPATLRAGAPYDLIIVDECFPYDTLIETDRGLLPIGRIVEDRMDVQVLSLNLETRTLEMKPIVRRIAKITREPLVKVDHEHGSFICTAVHKISVGHGVFERAGDLRPGETLLFLRQDLLAGKGKNAEILHEKMSTELPSQGLRGSCETSGGDRSSNRVSSGSGAELRDMRQGVFGRFFKHTINTATNLSGALRKLTSAQPAPRVGRGVQSASCAILEPAQRQESGYCVAHDVEQSYAQSGNPRQGDSFEKRQDVFISWGQRTINQAAGRNSGNNRIPYGTRDFDSRGAGSVCKSAQPLQGGFGDALAEDSGRGGWTHAQVEKVAVLGPPQNRSAECSRVVSVKILESGDRRGSDGVSGEADTVYDLEVADSHTYLANGVLVSNCHQMRDWNAFRTKCLYQPEDIQFVNPRGQIETRHVGAWSWAPRLWCLTGTPVVNSAVDLWPIFYGALRQDITWYDFAQRFCEKLIPSGSGDQAKPVGLKNAVELAERMRPFTLRRTLDSVGIALPPLSTYMQGFDLPQAVMTEIMAGLEDWSPQRLVAALENADTLTDANLMRVRRVLGLAKCPAVAHWVWDAIANWGCGPVVVFYWHQDVQAQLHRVLHGECGFRVATIQGKTTPKQLAEVEMQFQDGQFEVLLAQIQSAGQGLTLHRSNTCVTAESPWTAMALQQAFKRISRIGQARPCTATVLTVNGMWLEDVMGNIINRKQQASESLLQLLTSAA